MTPPLCPLCHWPEYNPTQHGFGFCVPKPMTTNSDSVDTSDVKCIEDGVLSTQPPATGDGETLADLITSYGTNILRGSMIAEVDRIAIENYVSAAVQEAVKTEREACETVAMGVVSSPFLMHHSVRMVAEEIADSIRRRSLVSEELHKEES